MGSGNRPRLFRRKDYEFRKWSALMAWFYKTRHKSPDVPVEVKDAIETLIDERQNEDDEEEDN